MSLSRLYKTASTAAQEMKALAANVNKQQMQITKETINQAKDRGKAEAAAREKLKQKSDLKADLDNAKLKAVTGFVTGTLLKAVGMYAAGQNAKASKENDATQKGMKTLNRKEELKGKVDAKIKEIDKKLADPKTSQKDREALTKQKEEMVKIKDEITKGEGAGGEFTKLQGSIENHESLREGEGKDNFTKAESKMNDLEKKFDDATGANKASTKIDGKINEINSAKETLQMQKKGLDPVKDKDKIAEIDKKIEKLDKAVGELTELKGKAEKLEATGKTDDVATKKELKDINKAAGKVVDGVKDELKETADATKARGDVKGEIDKVDADIKDVDDKVTKNKGRISDIDEKLKTATGPEKEALEKEKAGLEKENTALVGADGKGGVKAALEATKGQLQKAETKLNDAIAKGDKDAIKEAKKDVASAKAGAAAVHDVVAQMASLDGKINTIDNKVAKIDSEVGDIDKKLAELEKDPEGNKAEIASLKDKKAHLNEEKKILTDAKGKLETVKGKVEALGGKFLAAEKEKNDKLGKLDKNDPEYAKKAKEIEDKAAADVGAIGTELGNLSNSAELIEDIANKLVAIEKKLSEMAPDDPNRAKLEGAKKELQDTGKKIDDAIAKGDFSDEGLGKAVTDGRKSYDATTKGVAAGDGVEAKDGINDIVGEDETKGDHTKRWELDIKESFISKMLKYYNNANIKDVIGEALTKATYKAIKALSSRESAIHERVSALIVQMDMQKVSELQRKVQDAQKKVQEAQSKYEKAMKDSGKLEKELGDAKQTLANLTGTTDAAGQKAAISGAEDVLMQVAHRDSDGNVTETADEVAKRLQDPKELEAAIKAHPELADKLAKSAAIVNAAGGIEKAEKALNANNRTVSKAREEVNKAADNDPSKLGQFFGADKGLAQVQAELDEAIGKLEGSLAYLRGLYTMKYGSDRPDLGETGKVSLFGLDFKVEDDLQSMGKDLVEGASGTLAGANATSEQTRNLLLGAVGGAGSNLALDDAHAKSIAKMLAKGDKARYEAAKEGLDDLRALQKDTQDGKLGGGVTGKVIGGIMTMGLGHIPGIHTGIAGDPSADDKSVGFEDRRDALSDIINDYKSKVSNEGVVAVASARDVVNNYGGNEKDYKEFSGEVKDFVTEMHVADQNNKGVENASKALDELQGEGIAGIRGGGLLSVGGRMMTAESLGLDANAVKLNMMFNKAQAMQKKADLINGTNSGTESNAHLFTDPKFKDLSAGSAALMAKVEDAMADGKITPEELQSLKGEAATLLATVEGELKKGGLTPEQKESLELQRDMLKGAVSALGSLEKGPGAKASHAERLEWESKVQNALGLLMGGSQQLNAKSVGEATGWFGATWGYGGRTVAESGEQKSRNSLRKDMMGMLAQAEALEATTPEEQKAKADLIKSIKEQLHQLDTYGRVDMTQVETAMETYGEVHAEAQGKAFDNSMGGVKKMMETLVASGADMAKGFGAAIAKMTDKDGDKFTKSVGDMEQMVKDLHDAGVIDDTTFNKANEMIAAIRKGGAGSTDANTKAAELTTLLSEPLAKANATDLATKLIDSKGLTAAATTMIGIGNRGKDETVKKDLTTTVTTGLSNATTVLGLGRGSLNAFSGNLDGKYSDKLTQLNAGLDMLKETIDSLEAMGLLTADEAKGMRKQVDDLRNAGMALLTPGGDRDKLLADFNDKVTTLTGGLEKKLDGVKAEDVVKHLTDSKDSGGLGLSSSMALRTVSTGNRNLLDTVMAHVADGGLSTTLLTKGSDVAKMLQADPKLAGQFKLAMAERLANGGTVDFAALSAAFGGKLTAEIQGLYNQIKGADLITQKMGSGQQITEADLESVFGKGLSTLGEDERKDLRKLVEKYNAGEGGGLFSKNPATELREVIAAARDKAANGLQQKAAIAVGNELLTNSTGDKAKFTLSRSARADLTSAVATLSDADASDYDKQQAYATISGVAGNAGLGAVSDKMAANAPTVSNLMGGYMVGLGTWAGMYADAMGKGQFSFRTSRAAGGMDAADAFDFVGRLGLKESDVLLGQDAFTKLGIVPAGMTPGSATAALSQFLKGSYGASGSGAREAYLKLMNAIATGDGVGAQKAFEALKAAFGSLVTRSEALMKELGDPNVKMSPAERKAKTAELQGLVDEMSAIQMLMPEIATKVDDAFHGKAGMESFVNEVKGQAANAMTAMTTEGMIGAKKNGTTFETYRDAYQALAKGDIPGATDAVGKLEKRAGDLQATVEDKLLQLEELKASGKAGTMEYAKVLADLEAATLELGQITQMIGSLGKLTENTDGTVKAGMEGLHKTLVDVGSKSAMAIKSATIDAKGHATGLADVGNQGALEDGRGVAADQDAAALLGKAQNFYDDIQAYLDAGDYGKAAQVIEEYFGKQGDMMDQLVQLLGADNPQVQALMKAKDRIEKLIDPKTGRVLDSGKMEDAVKDFMQAFRVADDLVSDRYGTQESQGTSSVAYSENAALETAIKLSDGLRERIEKALADKGGKDKKLNADNLGDVEAIMQEAYNDGLIGEADWKALQSEFKKAHEGGATYDFDKLMARVNNIADRFETTAMTKATAGIQFEGALKGLAKATNGDQRQTAAANANDAIDDMEKAGILDASQAAVLRTMVKALADGSEDDLRSDATPGEILAARNEMAKAIQVLGDLGLIDKQTAGELTVALGTADQAILRGGKDAVDAVNDLRGKLRGAIQEDVIGKLADGTASGILQKMGANVEMEAADPKEAYDNMRRNLLTRAQKTVADLMAKGDTAALTPGEKLALQSAIDVLELNGNLTADEASGLRTAVDQGDVGALKKSLTAVPTDGKSMADRVANAHLSAASTVMNRLSSTAQERGFIQDLGKDVDALFARLAADPKDTGAKDELTTIIKQMKELGLITAAKADELEKGVLAGDPNVKKALDTLLSGKAVGGDITGWMKDLAATDQGTKDKAVAALKGQIDQALADGKITESEAQSLKSRVDEVANGNKKVDLDSLTRELKLTGNALERFEAKFSAGGFAGNADLARRMRDLTFRSAQAAVAKQFFDNLSKVDLKKLQAENPAAFKLKMDQLRSQTQALMDAGVLSEEFGTAMLHDIETGNLKDLGKDIDRADELIGTHQELIDKEMARNRDGLGMKIAETLANDVDTLLTRLSEAEAFNSAENRADVLVELDKVIKRAEALAATTGDAGVAGLVDALKELKGKLDTGDLKDVQTDRLTETAKAMTEIKDLAGKLRSHLETDFGVTLGGAAGGASASKMKEDATDAALLLAQAILKDGKVDASNLVLVAQGLEQDLDGLLTMEGADPELVSAAKRLDEASRAYDKLLKSPTATTEEKDKAKAELMASIKGVELALLKNRPNATAVTVGLGATDVTVPSTDSPSEMNKRASKFRSGFAHKHNFKSDKYVDATGGLTDKQNWQKEAEEVERSIANDKHDLLATLFTGTDGEDGYGNTKHVDGQIQGITDYLSRFIEFKQNIKSGALKFDPKPGSADYKLAESLMTDDEKANLLNKTDPESRQKMADLIQTRLTALAMLASGKSMDDVTNKLKEMHLDGKDANLSAFLTAKEVLSKDGKTVDPSKAQGVFLDKGMREVLAKSMNEAKVTMSKVTLSGGSLMYNGKALEFRQGYNRKAELAFLQKNAGVTWAMSRWNTTAQSIEDDQVKLKDLKAKIAGKSSTTPEQTDFTEDDRLKFKAKLIADLKANNPDHMTDAQIEEVAEIVSQLEAYRTQDQDQSKLIKIAREMSKKLDDAGLVDPAARSKALGTMISSIQAGLSGDLAKGDADVTAFIAKSLDSYLKVQSVQAEQDFVDKFTTYKDQLAENAINLGSDLGYAVYSKLASLSEADIRKAFKDNHGDAAAAIKQLLGTDGLEAATLVENDLRLKQGTATLNVLALGNAYDLLKEKKAATGGSTIDNAIANTDEETKVLEILAAHGGKIDEETLKDILKDPKALLALQQHLALEGKSTTIKTVDDLAVAIGWMAQHLKGQIGALASANSEATKQWFGNAAAMLDNLNKLSALTGHTKGKSLLGTDGAVAGMDGDAFKTMQAQMEGTHKDLQEFSKLGLKTLLGLKTEAQADADDAKSKTDFLRSADQALQGTVGTAKALKDIGLLRDAAVKDAEAGNKEAEAFQKKQVELAIDLEDTTGIAASDTLGFKSLAAEALGFGGNEFLKAGALEMAASLAKMLMANKGGKDGTVDMESIGKDADKAGKDALKAQQELQKKLEKLAKKLKEDRIAAEQAETKEYIKRLGKEYEVAGANLMMARKALGTAMATGNKAAAEAALGALLQAAKTFENVQGVVKELEKRDANANGGNNSQEFLAFKDSIKGIEQEANKILDELKSNTLQEAVHGMGSKEGDAKALAVSGATISESVTKGMSTGAIVKQVLRRLESDEPGSSKTKGSAKGDDDDVLSEDDVRTLFAFADGEQVTSTKEGRKRLQDLINQAGEAGNSGDPAKAIQLASQIKALLADTASDPTGTGINLSKQQRGALAALANVIEHNASMMGKGKLDDDDKELLKLQAGNAQLLLADVMRVNKGELSDDTVVVGNPDKTDKTKTDEPASLADRYKEAAAKVRQADKHIDSKSKVNARLDEIEALLTPAEQAALKTDAGNGAEVLAKIRAAVKDGNLTGSSSSARALLAQLESALNTAALDAEKLQPKPTSTTSSSTVTTTTKGKVEPTSHKGGSGVTMNDVMHSKGDLVNYDNLYALLPKMRKQEASGDLVTYDPRFAAVDQSRTNAIAARTNFDAAADAYYKSAVGLQGAENTYLDALNVERLATKSYEIGGLGKTNAKMTDAEVASLKTGAQALLDAKVMRNGKEEFLVTDEATRKQLKSLASGDGKVTADQLAAVTSAANSAKERVTEATNVMDRAKKDMQVKQEVFLKADAKLQDDVQNLRSGMGSGVLGGEYSMGGSLSASIDAYKKVLEGMLAYEQDNASFDDVHSEQASKLEDGQKGLALKQKGTLDAIKSDAAYLKVAQEAGQTTKGNLTTELNDTQTSIKALEPKIATMNKQQLDLSADVTGLSVYKSKLQDVDEAYKALKSAWDASGGNVNDADVQKQAARLKTALAALPATAPAGAPGNLADIKSNGDLLVKSVTDKNASAVKGQLEGTGTKQNFGATLNGALTSIDKTLTDKNKQIEVNQKTLSSDVAVLGNLKSQEIRLKKEIGDGSLGGDKDPSAKLTALTKTVANVHADGLEAAADLDKIGTRLGAPTVKSTDNETVSDETGSHGLTAREQRLISEIGQMDKYKAKVVEAEQFGSTGEKNAALGKVRSEMKGSALADGVAGKRQEKEQEIKKSYMSYLNAEMRVIDAKERGASPDEIKKLERDAKRLERQYNATNGRTWRDGLIAAFGGDSGKYALMALKYGLELIMEAIKQQKRVQELEALYAKALKEERELAVEMAMYAAGPRRA